MVAQIFIGDGKQSPTYNRCNVRHYRLLLHNLLIFIFQSVQPGFSASQSRGIVYLIIALVLFLIGWITCLLIICLWPIAAVFLILGVLELSKPPEQTQVSTV